MKITLFKPRFVIRCSGIMGSFGIMGIILIAGGTAQGLFLSPPDLYQGDWVRMLYIHVPCSWIALGLYTALGFLSGFSLIYKTPVTRMIAQSCGWIGLFFACLSVITGMIWGKPTWGTWWVWDARLTSMALLIFLYAGFVMLEKRSQAHHTPGYGSVLGVLGLVNLPIIKGSVTWWATLHQPASIVWNARPAIDTVFLVPLLLMTTGMACCTCFMVYALTLDRLTLYPQGHTRLTPFEPRI